MRAPSYRTRRHVQGMSLLELVVVIALIGTVIAIVGSRLIGGQDRANFKLAETQLNTLVGKIVGSPGTELEFAL